MKALVTGGTGFIGKHLVRYLLKKGVFIRLLIRKSPCPEEFKTANLEIVYGDLSDINSLKGITKNIDIVYHLAAQLGEWGIPDDKYWKVNVYGTQNLLESCNKDNIKHFIFVSTPGVIGFCGNLLANETFPYRPRNIYEKTKVEAEKLIIESFHKKKLPTTIIRPDFVYGPGDLRRLRLFRAIKDKRFVILGNGKTLVRPTYIDDVIKGFELITNKTNAKGEIYNIAGPKELSLEEFIRTIADILGVRIPRFKIPKLFAYTGSFLIEKIWNFMNKQPPITRGMVQFLTIGHASDISKAKRELNYNPEINLRDGIERTIEWYKKEGLI